MDLPRALALALGATLVLTAVVMGLGTIFAPGFSVNPLQADPESPEVNLVTALVLFFVGALLALKNAPARTA